MGRSEYANEMARRATFRVSEIKKGGARKPLGFPRVRPGTSKQKTDPKAGFVWRYLADSNRRTRFCRPIPSRSVKVPFAFAVAKVMDFLIPPL